MTHLKMLNLSLYTWIRRSFILVLCWSSMMVSSFRSFCTNSVAALFFWVRREAQMARNTTVLSSLGFPDGLSITPTRTPGLAFCMDARKRANTENGPILSLRIYIIGLPNAFNLHFTTTSYWRVASMGGCSTTKYKDMTPSVWQHHRK